MVLLPVFVFLFFSSSYVFFFLSLHICVILDWRRWVLFMLVGLLVVKRELELLMGCILVSSENTENEIIENNFFSFSTFVHKVRFVFKKRFVRDENLFVRENENNAPNVYL
ncbi:unnamed protein product [Prunus armeniaca]